MAVHLVPRGKPGRQPGDGRGVMRGGSMTSWLPRFGAGVSQRKDQPSQQGFVLSCSCRAHPSRRAGQVRKNER